MKSNVWPHTLQAASVVAVLFGLLTIREGGAVLFFDGAARLAAGEYVPFVLWFNFIAGFAYVMAGLGLWFRRKWAARVAIGIAVATLFVFASFGWHVASGGMFEMRTVIAMTLRSTIWLMIAILAWWVLLKSMTQSTLAKGQQPDNLFRAIK